MKWHLWTFQRKWLYTQNFTLSQATEQVWKSKKNIWVCFSFVFIFQGLKILPPKSPMWKSFLKKPEASETSRKQAWNEWDINQEDDVGINRSIQRPIEEKEKPAGELSVAHLADYMGDSEGLKNDVFKMFHHNGRAVYWFSTYKFTQREDMKEISEWQNRRPAWPTGQHKTDGGSDRKGEGRQEGNILIPPNLCSKTQRTESSLKLHRYWVDVLKQ